MGVSRVAHTKYAYIWQCPPPPGIFPNVQVQKNTETAVNYIMLKSNPLGLKKKLRMKENLPYVKPKQLKLNRRGLVQAFDLGNFYGNLT